MIQIRQTLMAEHQALLLRLSNRQSVVFFARAAVSSLVAVVVGIIGANFDASAYETDPWLPFGTFGIAGVFSIYVAICIVRGRSAWLHERQAIDRLLWLRSTLGVDDPSVILP